MSCIPHSPSAPLVGVFKIIIIIYICSLLCYSLCCFSRSSTNDVSLAAGESDEAKRERELKTAKQLEEWLSRRSIRDMARRAP